MPQVTNNEYLQNGVLLSPSVPQVHGKVKVVYRGLLPQNGATHVYARVGFGRTWRNTHDYEMEHTTNGFETTIPVLQSDTLNIAFKDCANNWDNNSGMNYSFDVDY